MRHRYAWELAIVGVTVVWGATFVMVKNAVAVIPVMWFVLLRFSIASVLVAIAGAQQMTRVRRVDVMAGTIAGLVLFASFTFQTAALQQTISSNVGFITGLYVVMVPLLAAIVFRRLPSRASLVAVLLAAVGLYLLANPSTRRFGAGEMYALLCAFGYAVQILIVDRYAKRVSLVPFTFVQMAVVAMCAAVGAGVTGPVHHLGSRAVWEAVAVTATLASAAGYWIQVGAQRYVPPTRSAILFAMESPFAAVFGLALAGDRIGVAGWVGGALMVAGVLVTETRSPAAEAA
jgi:drug/metabolite transporter (DMT)-like permease